MTYIMNGGGTTVVIPRTPNAAVLKKLTKMYPNANIQPSQLRLEKVLSDNDGQFRRTLGKDSNAGNLRPTEMLLGQNDSFVCTHMSIGLQTVPILTASAQRGGNSPIYYYPDKNVFTEVATLANVSEADALESIYQGFLSMKSDSSEVIDIQDTLRYRVVPRTQFTATTVPSYEGKERVEFDSPVIFQGKKSNEIVINFAPSADRAQLGGKTDERTNVLVVLFYGFKIRNASEPVTVEEFVHQGKLLM